MPAVIQTAVRHESVLTRKQQPTEIALTVHCGNNWLGTFNASK